MSEIVVQKFGGTSVGTVDRIDSVAEIIKNASKSNKIVVVVSAMGGETNRLVDLAKAFGDDPDKREFDDLINNWEVSTKKLIDELSKRKENLLKDKSPNSLIALGAMEVHLNMALQALNAFNKGVDG